MCGRATTFYSAGCYKIITVAAKGKPINRSVGRAGGGDQEGQGILSLPAKAMPVTLNNNNARRRYFLFHPQKELEPGIPCEGLH